MLEKGPESGVDTLNFFTGPGAMAWRGGGGIRYFGGSPDYYFYQKESGILAYLAIAQANYDIKELAKKFY